MIKNLNGVQALFGKAATLKLVQLLDSCCGGSDALYKQTVKSGIFTITSLAGYYIDVNTSAVPASGTLPLASSVQAGTTFVISDYIGNASHNPIVILCAGTDTINGSPSREMLVNYESITLHSDGVSRWVVS